MAELFVSVTVEGQEVTGLLERLVVEETTRADIAAAFTDAD